VSFEQMMAELKKDYVSGLPEKTKIIRGFLHQRSVAELQNEFHKLKGTGKTYGLPEVSELGLTIETVLKTTNELHEDLLNLAIACLEKIHKQRAAAIDQVPAPLEELHQIKTRADQILKR